MDSTLYLKQIIELKKLIKSKDNEIDKLKEKIQSEKEKNKKCSLCNLSLKKTRWFSEYSYEQKNRIKNYIEKVLIELDDKLTVGCLKVETVRIVNIEDANTDFKNSFLSHIEKARFIDCKFRIKCQLESFLKSQDLDTFRGPLRVKISLDGTNVGRNLKLINFTFTILNESDKAKTASGNYTLGIANLNEDYDELKEPMLYLSSEIESLKELTFSYKVFQIEYFFCSDWKTSAVVLGLYAASSSYTCLWCTANKDDFSELDNNFSISDKNFFARNKEDHIDVVEKKRKKNLGYKHLSLMPNFDYTHCILDMLHLFLRITDVLLGLL
ncbi:unnamed protein product [Brachionus calyciflorus]|uniref:Uncharacterized protein n=1 Tax=Brachionus calyciflorus TaxID=104777 RepID=A0A814PYT6_9BILA|nr:unnamed protein product [Brachionus calyciflorus]